MRKLIAILLLLSLLIPSAFAEDPTAEMTAAEPETPVLTAAAPLAPELTAGGYVPNPEGFVEADEANGVKAGYYDESLSITLEKIEVDGVNYNVARVKVADASQLRTAAEDPAKGKKSNYIHNIAPDYNAVLAMSADFFAKNKGGYVLRQGKLFYNKPYSKRDMLLIDSNGDFHIIFKENGKVKQELAAILDRTDITITNVFNFGPTLVADGKALELPKDYANFNLKRPEPRCAIAQVGPLEYLLVVADGRTDDSTGATFDQLAAFMESLGCITAYNLDGGDTAMLWFNGEYYSRKTKRAQSDIIYIATAVNPDAAATEE